MYPDSPFAIPHGSFQSPVPIPAGDPDGSPSRTFTLACSWLPYIRGALAQLLLQATWDTDDPAALNLVQARAATLISMFDECSSAPIYPFACPYAWDTSESEMGWSAVDYAGCTTYALWDGNGFEAVHVAGCVDPGWQAQIWLDVSDLHIDTVTIVYTSVGNIAFECANKNGSDDVAGGTWPAGTERTASFVVNRDRTGVRIIATNDPFDSSGADFKLNSITLTGYKSTPGCP